ncbi:glycosyltransferase family 2 protein [uncultured Williamsia sp.]|uniref:glycosyltransferase family 2 protein n=1 Tax=uncultured Williamsia sp. TaxID=259311 RepID=UPI0026371E37|nr:glycosyltransferase family 2 protein [uncultured Williamsia sp.]
MTNPALASRDEPTGSVDVSILMVTYNAADWTRRSLAAVPAGVKRHSWELIVVDNASPEVEPEQLLEWAGPDATVEFLTENIGFGRGVNHASGLARGRTLLLLNPDAEVAEGAIDELLDYLDEDPRRGIVGGRIFTPEGDLDRGSCFGEQTTWSLLCYATGLSALFPHSGLLNPEGLGRWDRSTPREVGVVTGCMLLVDHDLWRHLDGFDSDYFMYGEDADLCKRARTMGFRPSVTNDACATHALGESSSRLVDKQIMMYRGKVTLIDKNTTGAVRAAQKRCLIIGVAVRALMERVADRGLQWGELYARRAEWRDGWSRNLQSTAR